MSEYDDEDFDEDNDPYAYLSHRREENSSNTSLGKPPMHNHSNAREVTSPTSRPQQQQQQHQQEVTTVCCGCRPKATSTKWKRYKKKSRFNIFSSSTQYYDAQEDASPATANAVGRSQAQKQRQKQYEENVSESSMYFFDAVETPLGEDEYPPYFTTSIAHPKPKVSLEDPITLLKHSPTSPVNNDDEIHPQKPISSHKRRSVRWEQITRRPTMEHAQALSSPRVAQDEKGYPGGLTVAELEECVSSYTPIYTSTYITCSTFCFLFYVAKILTRLESPRSRCHGSSLFLSRCRRRTLHHLPVVTCY